MRTISANDAAPETDHGYALPFVATAQYSSPAYLFREDSATEDMWKALTFYQLGAVLHDLVMQRPLFDSEVRTQNRYRVAAAVLRETPEIYATDVAPWLVTLARTCLVKEDDLRLARVRWSSFHTGRRSSVQELRARLELEPSAPANNRTSAIHAQEQLRVRLDEARDLLVDVCRNVLIAEGFPPAGMTNDSQPLSRTVGFSFVPRAAAGATAEVHFVLRISARGQPHDQVDIFLTSLLTKRGLPASDWAGTLMWSSRLEALAREEEQLSSLLTEEFIRRYAAADDRMAAFVDQDETRVEITPDEE